MGALPPGRRLGGVPGKHRKQLATTCPATTCDELLRPHEAHPSDPGSLLLGRLHTAKQFCQPPTGILSPGFGEV